MNGIDETTKHSGNSKKTEGRRCSPSGKHQKRISRRPMMEQADKAC